MTGLISQLTNPTDPTAVATFDAFVQAFADQLDGLWASTMMDVAIVTNVAAFKLAAQTFRGTAANGGPVETAAAWLSKMTGGFWCNSRMPATASRRLTAAAMNTSTPRVWPRRAAGGRTPRRSDGTRGAIGSWRGPDGKVHRVLARPPRRSAGGRRR